MVVVLPLSGGSLLLAPFVRAFVQRSRYLFLPVASSLPFHPLPQRLMEEELAQVAGLQTQARLFQSQSRSEPIFKLFVL